MLKLLSSTFLLSLLVACLPQEKADGAKPAAQAEATPAEPVAAVKTHQAEPSPQVSDDPLRMCVLAYNLPFSQEEPDENGLRGIYHDMAKALGQKMGKSVEMHYVLQAFYTRPVRHGLMLGNCALQIGLPRMEGDYMMGRRVGLTQSFMTVGYAFVVPRGVDIRSLDDLKGMTVAVQPGAPPQEALNDYPGVKTVLVKDPDPVFDMIEKGEIDAAFVWGPTVGYLNRYQYDGKYQIIDTDIQFPVAIAMMADQMEQKPKLDQHLEEMAPRVAELREKYGFPSGNQVKVKQRLPLLE